MSSVTLPPRKLLMVGMSATTYRIGNIVRKECRIASDDPATTEQNLEACATEANVYRILGSHALIAQCLAVGPRLEYIELAYYPHGNLREYRSRHSASIPRAALLRWARQMLQSVAYVHGHGVRHSDLRLDQWLLDEGLNARLCDFNGAGYDTQPLLGLQARAAISLESPSHCLPRDPDLDNTVKSDLFALGSSLYELEAGHKPYNGLDHCLIESRFSQRIFPTLDGLELAELIEACWTCRFVSADEVIRHFHHSLHLDHNQTKSTEMVH